MNTISNFQKNLRASTFILTLAIAVRIWTLNSLISMQQWSLILFALFAILSLCEGVEAVFTSTPLHYKRRQACIDFGFTFLITSVIVYWGVSNPSLLNFHLLFH